MSSDLQIVVNLKGVFMGKLKEKLSRKTGRDVSSLHRSLFDVHGNGLLCAYVCS